MYLDNILKKSEPKEPLFEIMALGVGAHSGEGTLFKEIQYSYLDQ